MAEVVELQHRPDGIALTHQALSPKHGGGWHTLWWTGQDPRYPAAANWSGDPSRAAVFRTEAEAVEAFAALGNSHYQLPAPQLLLGAEDAAGGQRCPACGSTAVVPVDPDLGDDEWLVCESCQVDFFAECVDPDCDCHDYEDHYAPPEYVRPMQTLWALPQYL
jgi:hypothetical protein